MSSEKSHSVFNFSKVQPFEGCDLKLEWPHGSYVATLTVDPVGCTGHMQLMVSFSWGVIYEEKHIRVHTCNGKRLVMSSVTILSSYDSLADCMHAWLVN